MIAAVPDLWWLIRPSRFVGITEQDPVLFHLARWLRFSVKQPPGIEWLWNPIALGSVKNLKAHQVAIVVVKYDAGLVFIALSHGA
jgi:hypothetical protein